jgi:hypothetical protein
MVGYYYRLRLIERGFPPTNLTMLYATHAVSKSGVLCLQDIVGNWMGT